MTGDEIEDVGHEKRESAFVNSENHEFAGDKLQPYSMARRAAAQSIGLAYGALDSAHVARYNATKVYPGALRDVAVVLWLCSLTDEREIDRAARDPISAADKALKWLESKEIIDTVSDGFVDAYIQFFKIMDEVEVSRATAQKKMTQPVE